MNQQAGNGLTLRELEEIEEAAHHSEHCDSKILLRVAAALREALQEKENAEALTSIYKRKSEKQLL